MSEAKIFFGSNLKFLRERQKLSQEALARKLSVTRAKLVAIETGQTKSPPPEDFVRFSEYFKISVDSLLKVDLSKLGELKLRELEAGNDVYIKGGNLRVLAITVDKTNKENVEYVPLNVKAGYASGYNDPEFIASLPKFNVPNLPKGGTFRVFPITGDSMLPIPSGSDVTGRYIADWNNIKPGTPCIVILKNQDLVFKRVTIDKEGVLLVSQNPAYEPYRVPIEEVVEIWLFHSYTSVQLPEYPGDVQPDHVLDMFRTLRSDIQALSTRK